MKEIVINTCFGGFSLSYEAVMAYAELKRIKLYPFVDDYLLKSYKQRGEEITVDSPNAIVHYTLVPQEEYNKIIAVEREKPISTGRFEKSNALYFSERGILRDDPSLIKVVRKLKAKANRRYTKLKIVKIPSNIEYTIEEYDGVEHIAEKHRTWG